MGIKLPERRIDWKVERDRIDLVAVAISLLGPPPGRRGERGSRFWWRCPFHDDQNPSFAVDVKGWRCFGCGSKGDAADLVMRLTGKTFPETCVYLTGGLTSSAKSLPRPTSTANPREDRPVAPSGLSEADALALVEAAEDRLWTSEGADALAYLTGLERCLTLGTIRTARLGVTSRAQIPKACGTYFHALGVVIPWFETGRLALVQIRQPDDRRPKYVEAFRDPTRLVCYPGPAAIQPSGPLIVTEGAFDALLLGQELRAIASVITLGSASTRPDRSVLRLAWVAPTWFVATDADAAGEKAFDAWPSSARRVRPPGSFKDWTEAKAGGINLTRWWRDRMAGIDPPDLFTWDELTAKRWGPAIEDITPGLVIDEPDPARHMAALKAIFTEGPGEADETGLDRYPRWSDRPNQEEAERG